MSQIKMYYTLNKYILTHDNSLLVKLIMKSSLLFPVLYIFLNHRSSLMCNPRCIKRRQNRTANPLVDEHTSYLLTSPSGL